MPPGKRPNKGGDSNQYNTYDDDAEDVKARRERQSGKRGNPAISAVHRRMKKGEPQEDEPGFNSQTMGNRMRKPGSPNAKMLVETGQLRTRSAPGTQKRPRTKQKMDFAAAVGRRLKAKKTKS